MPLRARIKNQDIISVDHSDDQWENLKKEIKKDKLMVYLSCCDGQGFLRTSKLGLKHFAHKKSENICDWKPESPEHLWVKKAIVEGCITAGWNGVPEFTGDNWRADVLAFQGNKKIAFEVQWSPQTYQETKFRQERYKNSGVRGCWFFKKPSGKTRIDFDELIHNQSIPTFILQKDENQKIFSELNNRKITITELVANLLNGHVKFRENYEILKGKLIAIIFFDIKCWKCKRSQHLYTVPDHFSSTVKSTCGIPSEKFISFNGFELDFNSTIINSVLDFSKTELGKNLKIGKIKNRYSRTVGESYLSHGCFYCDSIFGHHFMFNEKFDALYSKQSIQIQLSQNLKIKEAHWCFSKEFIFCSD